MITEAQPKPIKTTRLFKQAALLTAQTVSAFNDAQIHQLAAAIPLCYHRGDNGYELAKKIEYLVERPLFVINGPVIAALETMDSNVRKLYHEAYQHWAQETGQPVPLPFGTVCSKGIIAGISECYDSSYLVSDNTLYPGMLMLVKFNDTAVQELKP